MLLKMANYTSLPLLRHVLLYMLFSFSQPMSIFFKLMLLLNYQNLVIFTSKYNSKHTLQSVIEYNVFLDKDHVVLVQSSQWSYRSRSSQDCI